MSNNVFHNEKSNYKQNYNLNHNNFISDTTKSDAFEPTTRENAASTTLNNNNNTTQTATEKQALASKPKNDKYWTRPTFESRTTGPTWRGLMGPAAIGGALWLGAYYWNKGSSNTWGTFKAKSSHQALEALGMAPDVERATESTRQDHQKNIAGISKPTRIVNNSPRQAEHQALTYSQQRWNE